MKLTKIVYPIFFSFLLIAINFRIYILVCIINGGIFTDLDIFHNDVLYMIIKVITSLLLAFAVFYYHESKNEKLLSRLVNNISAILVSLVIGLILYDFSLKGFYVSAVDDLVWALYVFPFEIFECCLQLTAMTCCWNLVAELVILIPKAFQKDSVRIKTVLLASVGLFVVAGMVVHFTAGPLIRYNYGVLCAENKRYGAAYFHFSANPDYKDSRHQMLSVIKNEPLAALKYAAVRETVYFGSYEQDNNLDNGPEPIEWVVLHTEDKKTYLMSKYLLDYKQFETTNESAVWNECSLRQWINNEFYNTAFSKEEQLRIVPTQTYEDETISEDRVFFFDMSESDKIEELSYEGWNALPTEYAAVIADKSGSDNDYNYSYWLITSDQDPPNHVYNRGLSGYSPSSHVNEYNYIRPCVWVDISKI